jgi:DNA-binding XRE family transcriptional regulator
MIIILMILKSGRLKIIIYLNFVYRGGFLMIQKQVGLRIKEIRLSKNLSQEECAFNSELNRTYFGSVERGERNISIINLGKICDSFGISLREFFDSEIFRKDSK